jgi:hypothetical protein
LSARNVAKNGSDQQGAGSSADEGGGCVWTLVTDRVMSLAKNTTMTKIINNNDDNQRHHHILLPQILYKKK